MFIELVEIDDWYVVYFMDFIVGCFIFCFCNNGSYILCYCLWDILMFVCLMIYYSYKEIVCCSYMVVECYFL